MTDTQPVGNPRTYVDAIYAPRATLHLDDPGFHAFLCWVTVPLAAPLGAPATTTMPWWYVLCVAGLGLSVVLQRSTYRARVSTIHRAFCVRSWWRRLELTPATTLQVRESGGLVSLWLTDGRFLTLGQLPAPLVRSLSALLGQRPSDELSFRLRGLPAFGRWTRWLSWAPLIAAWIRPRLRVDASCVVLEWCRWARRLPLSNIVRLSVTGRGVELGLSNSTKIELVTFGGLSPRFHPHIFEFNELLCAHLRACRGRALARALQRYRTTAC